MKRLTKEVVNQRLADAGRTIRMTGPYNGTNSKTQFHDPDCGHEWDATPAHIMTGTNCPICNGTPKRTLEDLNQELADKERTVRFIGPYHGTDELTPIECLVCGHKWAARSYSVLKKNDCPECGKKSGGQKRRLTAEIVNQRLADAGLTVRLVGAYTTGDILTQFTDICGHSWEAKPSNILSGSGCRICYAESRHTLESINAALAPRGLHIKEFKGIATKTEAYCDNGHHWETWPSSLLGGYGCMQCFRDRITAAGETVNLALIAAGRTVRMVGEYHNARNATGFECLECGYRWKATPDNILRGKGCPRCAVMGYQMSRPGTLYILAADDGTYFKIGITNNYPERFKRLEAHTPFPFSPLALHHCEDGAIPQRMEKELHQILKAHNAGLTGFDGSNEWFKAQRPVLELIALL